jgi:hypothetical protein
MDVSLTYDCSRIDNHSVQALADRPMNLLFAQILAVSIMESPGSHIKARGLIKKISRLVGKSKCSYGAGEDNPVDAGVQSSLKQVTRSNHVDRINPLGMVTPILSNAGAMKDEIASGDSSVQRIDLQQIGSHHRNI